MDRTTASLSLHPGLPPLLSSQMPNDAFAFPHPLFLCRQTLPILLTNRFYFLLCSSAVQHLCSSRSLTRPLLAPPSHVKPPGPSPSRETPWPLPHATTPGPDALSDTCRFKIPLNVKIGICLTQVEETATPIRGLAQGIPVYSRCVRATSPGQGGRRLQRGAKQGD